MVTWGHKNYGGESRSVQHKLRDVLQIFSADCAFAAVLANGNVVTWGDPTMGGDSTKVQSELRNVIAIHATSTAFAAISSDGKCIVWGDEERGGRRRCKYNKDSSDSWWNLVWPFQ